jgi:hypothetical protein
MAHFAELDENNKVIRVIVIDNKDTSDANGVEKEYIGQAFCERLFGGTWKQTSYSGSYRGRYAGPDFTYDEDLDEFLPPAPDELQQWNSEDGVWEPTVPMPDDGKQYVWDSPSLAWIEFDPDTM